MNELLPPRVCPACQCKPVATLRLRNGERLLRCPGCLLGWWNWPAFDPRQLYDHAYFSSDRAGVGYADYGSLEAGLRRTAQGRLHRIRQLLPGATASRLFEVGCGTGIFLDEARRAGLEVRGAEVSPYGAEQARSRGLDVACAGIEELPLSVEHFDCVCLWDVIEHVRDPARALKAAADALRPGGLLALSTGDITSLCARLSGRAWHLFNLPEHLYFFSPRSLTLLLQKAGCDVRRVRREVYWSPLAYLAERLGRKLRFRPPALLDGLVLPATLCDVLGMYAVKRPRKE